MLISGPRYRGLRWVDICPTLCVLGRMDAGIATVGFAHMEAPGGEV